MSLNLDKNGKPTAKIINNPKLKNKIVYVDDVADPDAFKYIKLTEGTFQQIPNYESERQVLYIFGPSGSGKSTYAANYIEQYKKYYPDNIVYVISAIDEDDKIDKLGVSRILIDDKMYTEPLEADDFKNSLVIFDDIDVLTGNIKKATYELLTKCLKIGRHFNISVIVTNHEACSGKETKGMLNESHSITYFPHSGGRSLKYLLTEYLDMSKQQILSIKKTGSRWATVFKNYPKVAMTEKLMFVLTDDD